MAIVKLYLHVCKQAAVCQKTLVTELLPLLGLKKPDFEKPFSDWSAPWSSPGNMGFGWTRLPAGWDAPVTWSHHGDPGPACHPQHLPGTLQGNESISFGLNPFSPLSSMEEWKKGKQMGKNTPP